MVYMNLIRLLKNVMLITRKNIFIIQVYNIYVGNCIIMLTINIKYHHTIK